MKAIMISIKPKYVADILNGKKTIEIRKSFPKCDLPIEVYIYCTKDDRNGLHWNTHKWVCVNNNTDVLKEICFNGKVVAKFTLNKVEEIVCRTICGDWESYTKTLGYSEIENASCLKNIDIVHYLKGKTGYAWHIDNLVIFDKPKEISEFRQEWYDCGGNFHRKPLTRAPQSWCYIEI